VEPQAAVMKDEDFLAQGRDHGHVGYAGVVPKAVASYKRLKRKKRKMVSPRGEVGLQ
jgi:hypothetical protein